MHMNKGLLTLIVFSLAFLLPHMSGLSRPKDMYDGFGLKPRIVVLTDIAPGDIEPDDM